MSTFDRTMWTATACHSRATDTNTCEIQMFGQKIEIKTCSDLPEQRKRLTDLDAIAERFLASRAIPKAGLCVDIGAGEGWFALPFAKAHPEWQVICFEPVPSAFEVLEDNVAILDLSNVTCVNAAFHPDLDRLGIAPRAAEKEVGLSRKLRAALKRTEEAIFKPLLAMGSRVAPVSADEVEKTILLPALPVDLIASLTPDLVRLDAPGAERAILADLQNVHAPFIFGALHSYVPSTLCTPGPNAGQREYYFVHGEHALRRDYEDRFTTRQARLDVVIAMYNAREFIAECIDSIIADNNPDIHVIVVDDGSTDGGGDLVLERYADHDRVHLKRKANGGCASARNYGRMHSNATHIAFIDADDRVDEGMFSALLETARYTGAFVVEAGFEFFEVQPDGTEAFTPSYEAEIYGGPGEHRIGDVSFSWLPGDVIAIGQPTIWRRVHRRDFLDRNNLWFPEHIRAFDDQIFQLLVVLYAGVIPHIRGYNYHYRQHPGQDIKQGDERHFYSFNMFKSVFLRALDENWKNMNPIYRSLLNTIGWSYSGIHDDLKPIYQEAASEFLAVVAKAFGHRFDHASLAATEVEGLEFLIDHKLRSMDGVPVNYGIMRLESWTWQPEFIQMMRAASDGEW
ncbi:FkbM family methyltransferase [Aquicoccus sp. SU-CL01552]|uniref:FkbM family methyltransferase n=1 Tax=Aquicoccus sp. SU-CL01552 TaxID=3127656 RepID=UPI00310380B5